MTQENYSRYIYPFKVTEKWLCNVYFSGRTDFWVLDEPQLWKITVMMTASFSVGLIHRSLQSAKMLTVQKYFLAECSLAPGFSVRGIFRHFDPLLTIPKTFFHKCTKSTHKLNTLFFGMLWTMNCKNVSNVGNLHKHQNLFKPIYHQSQTLLTP